MTDPNIPVTEDELHAYVDNELPAERRGDVEAWLAAHPDDAARVQSWRAMANMLHERYDLVLDEVVPKRLEIDRLVGQPRRWMYAAAAAVLAAFVAGGGVGWGARSLTESPSMFRNFTVDALDAHRLYVVEVRHPVEVGASERDHLVAWLSKRCGYEVKAPELEVTGLKLVGGRLLPGPQGPAAFLMYESPTGERFTLYASRADMKTTHMQYASSSGDGAMFWANGSVGYVFSGSADKDQLNRIARVVYDQTEFGS
jgi:anti-sigma factor RsiW